MSISAGLLNQTFTPQTLTETADNMGGVSKSWTDGTAFRGRLSGLSSQERMSNNKIMLESSHKIYCDYQTIDPTKRIRNSDSTRFFEIKGIVNPSDADYHLELWVREIDTNG